ncbi:MAG: DNA-processing protein DprA, partial [Verrucomicrobiales bacterium]
KNFPHRNRVVAAWSLALIVTESPLWSGSLITANLAAEYGRPVYAVPGPIDKPSSAGCNRLIRDGATLLTDGGELLDDLGGLSLPTTSAPRPPSSAKTQTPAADRPPLDEVETTVWQAVSHDESSIDHIIEQSQLPAATVTATLLKLEMKRLVRALPGFRYTRR